MTSTDRISDSIMTFKVEKLESQIELGYELKNKEEDERSMDREKVRKDGREYKEKQLTLPQQDDPVT